MALVPLTQQIQAAGFSNSDSMALATSSKNSRRKVERYVMDEKEAKAIYKMYYEKEPLIEMCKQHRYSHVFRGKMQVEWGGGGMKPLVLNAPNEQEPLVDLFKHVLDYRDMFGMVPIGILPRSKAKGEPRLYVPSFGSGKFILEYDPETYMCDVVYEVQKPYTAGKRGVTEVLKVFVWPGYMPSRMSRRFRSRISGIMGHFARINELRKNLLSADYLASHPLLVTQARPDNRSLAQMTEEEQFGAADDANIQSHSDRLDYRRDTHRAIRAEETAARMNAISLGNASSGYADNRAELNPDTGSMMNGIRSATHSVKLFNLPVGEEMSRGLQVSSRSDLLAMENEYQDLLCTIMGTPRAAIFGGVGGKYKGDADQIREVVRTAVMDDRSAINLFYPWAYELLNRKSDNDFLVNALISVDTREASLAQMPTEERRRIAEIRANIEKVAAMPFRTHVVFTEDPLPKKVQIPNLSLAISAGALTQLELYNLLRSDLGLPTIDNDHDLLQANGNDPDAPANEEMLPGQHDAESSDKGQQDPSDKADKEDAGKKAENKDASKNGKVDDKEKGKKESAGKEDKGKSKDNSDDKKNKSDKKETQTASESTKKKEKKTRKRGADGEAGKASDAKKQRKD